jgi:DNA repair exonuclease SbcCD ATPase subunit
MENFEKINTNSWSNIPTCVVQAINVLIETTKSHQTALDDTKSSLMDLGLKFSSKTNRYDSSIQDLSSLFKNFSAWATTQIAETKELAELASKNTEKKIKTLNELCSDLKNKYSSFYGEFRRENKEFINKFERLKSDTESLLTENSESNEKNAEYNLTKATAKFQKLFEDAQAGNKANKEEIDKISNEVQSHKHKIALVEDLIEETNAKILKLRNSIDKNFEKLEKNKKKVNSLHKKLELISNPDVNAPKTPDSQNSPEKVFINPFSERLNQIEETIEEIKQTHALSVKNIESNQSLDRLNLKSSIEKWTTTEIHKTIGDHFEKLKNKLEWLPDSSADIKSMSVTEARLFILESRIRQEEKARITSDQKLENVLRGSKILESAKNNSKKRIKFSPKNSKLIKSEFDKHKAQMLRTRPSSSSNYRDNFKEKIRDKFNITIV